MARAGGTVTTYQFDEPGRVKTSTQTINGVPYLFSYSYTLQDGLTSEAFPSTRIVNYDYSPQGQVQQVNGAKAGTTTNYTPAYPKITYAPHGALQSMTRGDGLVESWT